MDRTARGTLALIALLFVAAAPNFGPRELEGRWVADGTGLTLDLASCGTHVCALLVKPDKTCGATVMTMDTLQFDPDREGMALEGPLDLPGEPHPYERALVQAGFDDERKAAMDIWAHDKLHLEERNYAFEARLMRSGPALCRAAPSSGEASSRVNAILVELATPREDDACGLRRRA